MRVSGIPRIGVRLSLIGLAIAVLQEGAAQAASSRCPSLLANKQIMHRFADALLSRKDPRSAYETYADPAMLPRTKGFGNTRETTIKQWLTMTSRPAAWFHIRDINVSKEIAIIRFHGQLAPGNAANVVQHDRLQCGKIVEEWYDYEIIRAQSAGAKSK